MPQGDKDAYTDKQKRKAAHIEDGYEKRGVSHAEAESRPSGFAPIVAIQPLSSDRWKQPLTAKQCF